MTAAAAWKLLEMGARSRLLFAIGLPLALGAGAAASRQTLAPPQQPPSFKSGVTAVPIDVRVVGADGRPITDLTKEDFTILEDGVPQVIAHFSAQVLAAQPPRPGLRARPDTQPFDPSPQTLRVFLIVLGRAALGVPQRNPETLNALVRFVRESLLPQDQVALLAYDRATDFTSDHEKVARLLETFRGTEKAAKDALARQGKPAATDAGSVFAEPKALDLAPQVQTELGFEDYVKARRGEPLGELDSLFYGIKYLRYMSGEKHLVFVTERGPVPTWDQVKYLTALAADSRVALDTIQIGDRVGDLPSAPWIAPSQAALGLEGGAGQPESPASDKATRPREANRIETANAGGIGTGATTIESAVFDTSPIPGFKGLYDLRYVAAQTGGQASILKDAAPALARIDAATRAWYLLAYYPANGDWNGRYRTVKVLVNRPGATVFFRHGYYGRREAEVFDRRRVVSNTRIESAGYQLADIRDIDVRFVPKFTRSATGKGGEVLVPLSIDVTKLAWGFDAEGRHLARLEIAIYCGDAGNKILGQVRRLLNVALTDESFDTAMTSRFSRQMRVAVTGAPKFVKVIVYDYDADRVGSMLAKVPK